MTIERPRIKTARFITSLTGNQGFEGQGLPQIAVAGKSNVGKSSLINCLCGNHKLARISQEPGKTRLVNVFLLNDRSHLIDLPGYGFARVSRGMQEDWGRMMNEFLNGSPHLKLMLHLVDIRHEPGEHDQLMAKWIRAANLPFVVVATKADKLSKAQRQRAIFAIARTLGVQPWEIQPFSAQTREGKEELLARFPEGCL
ncbi:MAG: ribosome biogenesis GTP-binding protein YihA/YsxC [Christensenellaceae bacterium]|jgi:GTP-binding protein|nr:ribosome biogenesis GTP-binding protein YihA/YsxC [Christensenellaceae bacterium]